MVLCYSSLGKLIYVSMREEKRRNQVLELGSDVLLRYEGEGGGKLLTELVKDEN